MSIPIDAVETAARAAHELLRKDPAPWEILPEWEKDLYRDEARTTLMSVHADWRTRDNRIH